ncbi:MAG: YraN family protein [Gammaproteobacteria bacterium]|nr:YraN family protein [Gammaproteobacteria bacterium]
MRRDRNAEGEFWEEAASAYLARQGVRTLLRRYRCRLGELDLVCTDDASLIVVEVRARSSTRHASAADSVDYFKRRRIVQATRHLLMRHPTWGERPVRFDVVAIERIESAEPRIAWIRGAFDAD